MSVIERPITAPYHIDQVTVEVSDKTIEQQQVERGSAWLDENLPGWDANIDLAKLDQNNCFNCALAQAAELEFFKALAAFGLGHVAERELGFYVDRDSQDAAFGNFEAEQAAWDRLTEAWRDEIASRR